MLAIELKRRNQGWTLGFVAAKLNITQSSVQRIEKGTRRPSYDVLCKLEDLFELSHRDLLAQIDECKQKESKLL